MMAATTFVMMAVSIVFLTLTGAGLYPATVGVVALAVCLLAVVLGLIPAARPPSSLPPSPPSHALELWAMTALLAVIVSALPLPPFLDWLAGPLRHSQNQAVSDIFKQVAHAGLPGYDEAPRFCLSRNRAGSLRFFLMLAGVVGAAFLTARQSPAWKRSYLNFLAWFGAAVGVAGILAQWVIPQGDTIWWWLPVPHAPTSPVGCFLNRNHFGGFVAMLSPLALALADDCFRNRRWFGMTAYLALTGLMASVVFLSLSRGALIAMAGGLAVAALLIAFRHNRTWGMALIALLCTGAVVIVFSVAPVRHRLADLRHPSGMASVHSRMAEWRETLRVWPHYPLIGAGMNALRTVYPQHRQTSVGARLIHAENEYVQLLAEGGLLGVALLAGAALAYRRRLKGAPAVPPVLSTAVVGAVTVTGIHSLFDFPVHLPLYALILGSIAGLLLPLAATPPSLRSRLTAALPCLVGLAGTLVILSQRPVDLKIMDDPNHLQNATYKTLRQALVWAPTSTAWLYLGHAMYREGYIRRSYEFSALGESLVTRAAALDPNNYRLWYELGEVRVSLNKTNEAAEAFARAQALRSWLTPPVLPGGGR